MKLILLFTVLYHLLSVHGAVVRADFTVRDVALNSNSNRSAIHAPDFPSPIQISSQEVAPRANAANCGYSGRNAPSYCSGIQRGQVTYYETGLGACGIRNNNNDFIAAVSHSLFDTFPGHTANPNNNPVCGKRINISYQGRTITVTVTDRCEGCKLTDLDLSPAAFDRLAERRFGRINVSWQWA